MPRAKHYHVATGAGGVPIGMLEYNDGPESVHAFIKIVNAYFGSTAADPISVEMSMMENLDNGEQGVWAGSESSLVVVWTKCSCDRQPLYN